MRAVALYRNAKRDKRKPYVLANWVRYEMPDWESALWLEQMLKDLRRWGDGLPNDIRAIRGQTYMNEWTILERAREITFT